MAALARASWTVRYAASCASGPTPAPTGPSGRAEHGVRRIEGRSVDEFGHRGERLDRPFGGGVVTEQADESAQVVEDRPALLADLADAGVRLFRFGVDLSVDDPGHQGDAGQVVRGDVVEFAGHRGPFAREGRVDHGLAFADQRALFVPASGADLAAGPDDEGREQGQGDDADRLQDPLTDPGDQGCAVRGTTVFTVTPAATSAAAATRAGQRRSGGTVRTSRTTATPTGSAVRP